MPAEQSADASGPTWSWRLPRALPVTSPASCHGGASRAKYPTEPSQNSWRMAAQPGAWLRDFRDIPGNAPGLPVQDGHTLSGLFPRPAATVSGVQPAVGAVADSGFAQICAILHLPRKRDLRLSGQIWGDPHETRAAAHSASTVHPIHDVQPDHWRADTSPGPSPFLAFRGPVSRIPMPADPAGDKI